MRLPRSPLGLVEIESLSAKATADFDQVPETFDTVIGKSHGAVVIPSINPDETVFRFHPGGDV